MREKLARRFYAEPEQRDGSKITLDEREAHHIQNVLRAGVGEELTILDGRGREHVCKILQISKRSIRAEILSTKEHPPLPHNITLFQAIPKGKVMDSIVQKATELGAKRIVPILTERTVVELDADTTKVEKWRAIAIESLKQCGNPFLPEIDAPMPFTTALKRISGLALVAALHADAGEVGEFFGRDKLPVQIWIGPEGDFTPSEVQQLIAAGAHPITLGPLVLRCDTAAITALALAAHQIRTAQQ